jgi:hypothetical protein
MGFTTNHPDATMRELLLARGDVVETLHRIESMSGSERAQAFESHLVEDIEDTRPRERLDRALWSLGLLELGIQFGVADVDQAVAGKLFAIPEVRRYAFRYYPQLLPLLLDERLRGRTSVPASPEPRQGDFMDVLSLDKRLETRRIRRFLDVVDDYRYDGLPSMDELIIRLRKPDYVRRLLSGPRKGHYGDEAALGLLEFVDWSLSLKRTIDFMPALLGSATWHQFGYWMGLVGGTLYGVLATSVESVRDAIVEDSQEQGVVVSAMANIDEQLDALRWLTSSLYAAPLETWRSEARARDILLDAFRSKDQQGRQVAESPASSTRHLQSSSD